MRKWPWIAMILIAGLSRPAFAERAWMTLRTDSFGVVSQLREQDTQRWAAEFDQFVGALQSAYAMPPEALPPLTIVLFDRPGAFAPYRPVTESGQARKVEGMFGRRLGWSVIGLAGAKRSAETRRVVQHEAVHWFFSGYSTDFPLWLGEGFAEVYSTFEVIDGEGRLGASIPEHVAYLNAVGLQPMAEFLSVGRDEALHENRTYYPQAWAFVHYCMFGNGGAERSRLTEFLKLLLTRSTADAFLQAFGVSFKDFDRTLRRYLDGGRYSAARISVERADVAPKLTPASATQVEFALGRLALVGGNMDLAERHAQAVITAVPERPEGYEILAHARYQAENTAGGSEATARAIALGTRDATLFLIEAQRLVTAHLSDSEWLDQAIPPLQARVIADSVAQSLALHPHNAEAFQLLAIALANVPALSADDVALLDRGEQLFPKSGLMPFARATAAYRRGEFTLARALHLESRSDGRDLPPGMRLHSRSMGERWLFEEISDALSNARSPDDLDAVDALLAAEVADPAHPDRVRQALEDLVMQARDLRRLFAVDVATREGRIRAAEEMLQAMQDDPETSRFGRRAAAKALEALARDNPD